MSASRIYMHPRAQAAFKAACDAANLHPVIVQTLGSATQSAGTHAKDGTYPLNGANQAYAAALDLSTRQNARFNDGKPAKMNDERIKWLLFNLAKHGFVAWYRRPSQGFDAAHIHAIYVGVPMKDSLKRQVRDFLNDRTGLASHGPETYWTAPPEVDAKLRELYEVYN